MLPNQHSNGLLNIASAKKERDSSMNVTDGVEIGKEETKKKYAIFPDGLYSPIKIKVKLMKTEQTCVIGEIEIYSPVAIYTCKFVS